MEAGAHARRAVGYAGGLLAARNEIRAGRLPTDADTQIVFEVPRMEICGTVTSASYGADGVHDSHRRLCIAPRRFQALERPAA
jgi:hypothetical protein